MCQCSYESKADHVAAAARSRLGVSLSAWFGSSSLVRLVADEGDDHAVEVEEEHDEVEAELDEGFLKLVSAACKSGRKVGARAYLLVDVELSENLGRVQKVLVLEDPVSYEHMSLQEQSVCN